MEQSDDEKPYRVELDQGRFQVLDEENKAVIVCGDLGNAEQYAVLLNQAYRRGYKAGVRKNRER